MSPPDLMESFRRQVRQQPEAVAIRVLGEAGWREVTWRRWSDDAAALCSGLVGLGLVAGQSVAMAAGPGYPWALAELACLRLGTPLAGLSAEGSTEQMVEQLAAVGARVAIVEGARALDGLLAARDRLPRLAHVVVLHDRVESLPDGRRLMWRELPGEGRALGWAAVLEQGKAHLSRIPAWTGADPRTPSAITFSSGAGGVLRGVCHPRGRLAAQVQAVAEALSLDEQSDQLHLLPMSHLLGRTLALMPLVTGAAVAWGGGPATMEADLAEVRPRWAATTPLVLQGLHHRWQVQSESATPFKRQMDRLARAISKRASRSDLAGRRPARWVQATARAAHLTAFDRLHRSLGGRLSFFVCCGAPLDGELGRFFHQAKLPVLESYGLTEAAAFTHINRPGHVRPGTVGLPVEGVTCTLEAGEIVLSQVGPPAERLGTDGSLEPIPSPLHTGDLGEVDEAGHLILEGHRRDLLVTEQGQSVAPSIIEQALARHPLVQHAVLFGDGQPFLTALITLEPRGLNHWSEVHHLKARDYAARVRHPEVFQAIEAHVSQVNAELVVKVAVQKFALLERPLQVANGELTELGTVRRSGVAQSFSALLNSFYQESY